MSKFFRSCTALLMALCLTLGVCGIGVTASAVTTPDGADITRQDLVDWAQRVLSRISTSDITKDDVVNEVNKLVDEAKTILKKIEEIDVTKEGAADAIKELAAQAKAVLVRIQGLDVGEVVSVDQLKTVTGAAIAAVAVLADKTDITASDLKTLAGKAVDLVEKIRDIEFRETITADNMEKLIAQVIDTADNKIAQAENLLNEKKAELDQAIADAEAEIADAEDKIAEAEGKIADAQATIAEKQAELATVTDAARRAELEAEIAEKQADLSENQNKLADAVEQLDNAEADLDEAETTANNAIAKIEKVIKAAKKALNKVKPYADVELDDVQPVLDELFNLYDALTVLVTEGCYGGVREVQSAIYDLAVVSAELFEATTGKSSEKLEQAAATAKRKLDNLYNEATQTTLQCTDLTKIVALGDKNAYGASAETFASRVQEYLGKQPETFKNLTVADQTAASLRANLSSYASELSDATLITLGFDTNAFTRQAFRQLTRHVTGSTVRYNWAAYVGEANAAYVGEVLSELHNTLSAKGYNTQTVDAIVVFAESYAYTYIQHIASYYPLIRDIHAMNPDAWVVLVGTNNSLDDLNVEIQGVNVPLGEFTRCITDISNIYSLSYAMLSDNKLYVSAYDVDVDLDEDDFLNAKPSESGYNQIADRIWNALNIQDHDWEITEEIIPGKVENGSTVTKTCKHCGYQVVEISPATGDMFGVVVALLAVSGLGIVVLKRREN